MSRLYRTLQRHAHEKPALFWACAIGGIGPVVLAVSLPVSKALGFKPAPSVPTSYPLPSSPRKTLTGYDDPA
ncbi:hypothetical protein BKA62DRAFT_689199 [Auriculariales sp. MPI-PUGE-AT-0066]|nr:hypothetical protein BKA62DRAFT_689199 [Auriculariales sp. MPI-PUGE-AT-0066]